MRSDIRSQSLDDLRELMRSWGQPDYRARQVTDWLYRRKATSWQKMTNLPAALRSELDRHFTFHKLELVRRQGSRDTTQKFLWRLPDHALIETVLIPANPALYGEPSDRHTLCVSTQVGCAYGCRFCASGLDGWKRNLAPEEIIGQVFAVECACREVKCAASKSSGQPLQPDSRFVSNLVIMGMGEPLANYANLLKALSILNASWGGGIGARKITVSTSGLVPEIRRLADEPFQFRLAISLHGATDAVRGRIMPVNRKYPLKDLTAACEYYQSRKGKMLTFEYILIAGINDGLEQVKPLAQLCRRLHAKVNLIPYNQVEGLPWERPSEAHQEAFLSSLEGLGVSATLRREKGHDIAAACGQLRLRTERELAG